MNLSNVSADSLYPIYYEYNSNPTTEYMHSMPYMYTVPQTYSTDTYYYAPYYETGFYAFRVVDNNSYRAVICYPGTVGNQGNISFYRQVNNQNISTTYQYFYKNNTYNLLYTQLDPRDTTNTELTLYPSLELGLSAVRNYIDNPPTNTSGYTVIESGNIVYFELGSGKSYDIDLESQFYSKSGVVSDTWTDDNRRYGFSSELPVADTNFGETAGSGILWTKSVKGQNILGQTNIGDANITGTTTAKYLWIINPMYNNKYFEDSLDAKALNGLISVTGVPAGTTVYTYKLKQNASSIGLESTIPDVSGGTGTVSDTTGTQTTYVSTDDNETPYTQTVGGDNSAPEEVTATEGIRQTLDQLANSFSTLFLAPVEYIQNLISSGSAFMQTLGGIFSWLPESVVSVFLSALVLMIVIGVIKMLL